MRMKTMMILCGAAALGGCATTTSDAQFDRSLATQLAGQSQIQGGQLDAAVADSAQHPLGSAENPVRASMPAGQRAYLARLRCPDASAPTFARIGSFGIGPYQNIVDGYEVTCAGKASRTVVMDMYHQGHVETRPVPGFTIVDR